MFKHVGILLLSLAFTGILLVPFINLLYTLRFRQKQVRSRRTGGQRELHNWKVGTPIGGGILIIVSVLLFSSLFYLLTNYEMNWTTVALLLTLGLFGLLGLYDDVRKFFRLGKSRARVLPAWFKLLLQLVAAAAVAWVLYQYIGIESIRIPAIGPLIGFERLHLGLLFIPFATLTIVSSSNAFNITDGLDGLSTGLLLIALTALWYLAGLSPVAGDVILFIAVLMGALIAFLYFNIFPARLWMGDTGSLAFGAMIAVVALLIDQALILPFIGGMFVIEGASSLIQIASKNLRNGRKVFLLAPLHLHFEKLGWDETKVTMRFWLFGVILAWIGIFLATIEW